MQELKAVYLTQVEEINLIVDGSFCLSGPSAFQSQLYTQRFILSINCLDYCLGLLLTSLQVNTWSYLCLAWAWYIFLGRYSHLSSSASCLWLQIYLLLSQNSSSLVALPVLPDWLLANQHFAKPIQWQIFRVYKRIIPQHSLLQDHSRDVKQVSTLRIPKISSSVLIFSVCYQYLHSHINALESTFLFSLSILRSLCQIVYQVEHEKRQRTVASICSSPLLV